MQNRLDNFLQGKTFSGSQLKPPTKVRLPASESKPMEIENVRDRTPTKKTKSKKNEAPPSPVELCYKDPASLSEAEILEDVDFHLKNIDEAQIDQVFKKIHNNDDFHPSVWRYDIKYYARLAKLEDSRKAVRKYDEIGIATISYTISRQDYDNGWGDNGPSECVLEQSIEIGQRKMIEARYVALIAALRAAKDLGIKKVFVFNEDGTVDKQVRYRRQYDYKELKPLLNEALRLKDGFSECMI